MITTPTIKMTMTITTNSDFNKSSQMNVINNNNNI